MRTESGGLPGGGNFEPGHKEKDILGPTLGPCAAVSGPPDGDIFLSPQALAHLGTRCRAPEVDRWSHPCCVGISRSHHGPIWSGGGQGKHQVQHSALLGHMSCVAWPPPGPGTTELLRDSPLSISTAPPHPKASRRGEVGVPLPPSLPQASLWNRPPLLWILIMPGVLLPLLPGQRGCLPCLLGGCSRCCQDPTWVPSLSALPPGRLWRPELLGSRVRHRCSWGRPTRDQRKLVGNSPASLPLARDASLNPLSSGAPSPPTPVPTGMIFTGCLPSLAPSHSSSKLPGISSQRSCLHSSPSLRSASA